jgi:ABC-type multidrug transport system fused ATPase/permease subunit
VSARITAVRTSTRWAPVPDVVLALGTGIVLVAGGLAVQAGRLTVGELLVVLMYLGDLENPVRSMVRLTSVRAKATASALRLGEVLYCDEAVQDPPVPRPVPPVREGLRLESVSFSYSPDRPVLQDFDLFVGAGETVCLFGPSGAGKSTSLHLLLRLYDVDSGRVSIDGIDVREFSTVELRQRLAFVPQDPWLLDATLAENIAFGSATATRAQVLAAGRAAWVDEFALTLPEGYDTPLGESGVRLSGGQRRRVALARAVVSTAPVVLLDEPTTSLDAEAARQVVGAIRSATRDRTVLLVTHDPVLAAIADRTVHVAPRWRGVPALTPPATSGSTDSGSSAPGAAAIRTSRIEPGSAPSSIGPGVLGTGGR